MSWKSFACVAALSALTAPVVAAPSIGIVDNADGTGVVQITTDAAGAVGAELTLELATAVLTGASIADSIFDTMNPGANPYTGTTTNGLQLDLANNRLFVSYGSNVLAASTTYDFLDFTFTGDGTAQSAGLVSQLGSLNDGLDTGAVAITSGGSPPLLGDADMDGDVDGDDLIAVQTSFGNTAPPSPLFGDADFDDDVDGDDLIAVQTNFGNVAPATSVPEPTSVVLLAGLAGIGLAARRR